MSIEIVAYDADLKPRILELQRHLWGSDLAVNAAYFEWKYERNPYLDWRYVRLALEGDEVIGMRGIWGSRWEAGDPASSFDVPCAGDLVVVPDQRNRGLSRALIDAPMADLRADGHRYVFNLSGSLATQMGSLMSGWRKAGPLESARRVTGVGPLLQRLRRKARRVPLAQRTARRLGLFEPPKTRSFARPFEVLDRRSPSAADRVVVERAPRPEAMAELVRRLDHDGRLRHVRDPAYFSWRLDSPLRAYRFLFCEAERLEGYLVLDSSGRGHRPAVNIVDWEGSSPDVCADLLEAAVTWGAFPYLATWSVTLGPDKLKLLRDAGFAFGRAPETLGKAYRDAERRTQVLVKALREDDEDWSIGGCGLLSLDDWDLRPLYSDKF